MANDPGKEGAGPQPRLNPGDEARPGTPSTGEDICPQCNGKGQVASGPCPNCGGTGKVVKGIGGA